METIGFSPYLRVKHGDLEVWQIDGPHDTHATYAFTSKTHPEIIAWKRQQAFLALGAEIEKQKTHD